MKNSDKTELKRIVLDIPEDRIKSWSMVDLWKRYAPHVSYSTFKKYFKVFRKTSDKEKKK